MTITDLLRLKLKPPPVRANNHVGNIESDNDLKIHLKFPTKFKLSDLADFTKLDTSRGRIFIQLNFIDPIEI